MLRTSGSQSDESSFDIGPLQTTPSNSLVDETGEDTIDKFGTELLETPPLIFEHQTLSMDPERLGDLLQEVVDSETASDPDCPSEEDFLDAADEGDLQRVIHQVNNGVDVNFCNEDGETALHYASIKGFTDIMNYLLDRGADVDRIDKDGWTPLHWAANNRQSDAINLLFERGAHLVDVKLGSSARRTSVATASEESTDRAPTNSEEYLQQMLTKKEKLITSLRTELCENEEVISALQKSVDESKQMAIINETAPQDLTGEEVCLLFRSFGSTEPQIANLIAEQVDGEVLTSLSERELKTELGLSLGMRKKYTGWLHRNFNAAAFEQYIRWRLGEDDADDCLQELMDQWPKLFRSSDTVSGGSRLGSRLGGSKRRSRKPSSGPSKRDSELTE